MFDFFLARTEHLGNGLYLVTNYTGSYVVLNTEEYVMLMADKIDKHLFEILESNDIIITNANKSRIKNKIRYAKKHLLYGPLLHIVAVTNRCMHNCLYCHSPIVPVDRVEQDMSFKTAKRVVEFIWQSPSPVITIEFQGGEPLLNFKVIRFIVKYAKALNREKKKILKFTIVTNLTIMNKDILEFFEEEEIWPCTSIDGPEQLHNANRPNSYRDIKKWVPVLQRKLKGHVSAIAVITSKNIRNPEAIVDTYIKLGFRKIWVHPFQPLGNAKKNFKKLKFSTEDYLKFWKKIVAYIIEKNKKIKEVGTTFLIRKAIFNENPLFLDLQSPCGAVINQLAYDYNGDVYTCDEGRMLDIELFKLGNVNEGYSKVINKDKICSITKLSMNELFCERCAFQPYCGICPVMNYAKYNTPLPTPNDFRCKVLKEQFRFIFYMYHTDKKYKQIFDSWCKTKDL